MSDQARELRDIAETLGHDYRMPGCRRCRLERIADELDDDARGVSPAPPTPPGEPGRESVRSANAPDGDSRTPPEGRSDEGGDGWDSPATRKCAGAEATSESVVPSSSEPSPATRQQEADSGVPGSAATGPSSAPTQSAPPSASGRPDGKETP